MWLNSGFGLKYCRLPFVWSCHRDTAGHSALCNSQKVKKKILEKGAEIEWNSAGALKRNMDVLQGRCTKSSATKHFGFQLHCSPCVYGNKWISISEKVCMFMCICVCLEQLWSPDLTQSPVGLVPIKQSYTTIMLIVLYLCIFCYELIFLKGNLKN